MALFGRIPERTNRGTPPAMFPPAESGPLIPVHHIPPSPREMRAQAVHRLQVGMFGLAGMLLLVSLANVIMERAQMAGDNAGAGTGAGVAASSSAAAANDPLVDMGVAPELPVGDGAAKKPAKGNGQNR